VTKNILLVSSSPRGEDSYSPEIARLLADLVSANSSGVEITVRYLAADSLPIIDEDCVAGWTLWPHQRTVTQQAAIDLSGALMKELLEADVIVIACATFNTGPTSILKTWFGYVVRFGFKFSDSENRQQRLLSGKEAYLFLARGGIYPSRFAPHTSQETYTKRLLASLGLTNVRTIEIDEVAYGEALSDKTAA
jgi:FMN-dependent NADH-azoreductase